MNGFERILWIVKQVAKRDGIVQVGFVSRCAYPVIHGQPGEKVRYGLGIGHAVKTSTLLFRLSQQRYDKKQEKILTIQ
jgi:hypothetical protein